MIKLGVIGASGQEFSQLYAPALKSLRDRVRVTCVYDYVAHCARQSAELMEATVCRSFQELIHHWDVDAILMLSTGWPGILPYVECLRQNKSVYLADTCLLSEDALQQISTLAKSTNALTAVEHRLCFSPTGLRCQELMASELGRPQEMTCRLNPERSLIDQAGEIAAALGWFRWLLPGYEFLGTPLSTTPQKWTYQFQKTLRTQEVSVVIIHFCIQQDVNQFHIQTDRGQIWITGEDHLNWACGMENPGDLKSESLNQERHTIARQLDFFCRRLVGGLIPIHDLNNHLWSQQQTRLILNQLG
ncbi:hypothetical protein [Rubinisphaera sp.]|uniref:hypothetical protein n=1 Tax=Rubinisphaera sp. TaxID=2024857 RepID=UPI000C109CF2|nr:hypothetical protein [Rubinisphaera sp.]MBV10886.1 hypothetical protein [Rubinisphaera sp.]HCS54811.1 hypothetical protein [Planctomycetaceae bacterium]|tara:strand:- start:218 stop:1126 length:909 start_codon:yes stop_codon:yes gene_type:complete